jgi:hypothetical protein
MDIHKIIKNGQKDNMQKISHKKKPPKNFNATFESNNFNVRHCNRRFLLWFFFLHFSVGNLNKKSNSSLKSEICVFK